MRNGQAHCQENRENPEVQSPFWGTQEEKQSCEDHPPPQREAQPLLRPEIDAGNNTPIFAVRQSKPQWSCWFTQKSSLVHSWNLTQPIILTNNNRSSWVMTPLFYFVSFSFFSNYLNTIMNDVSVLFFGNTLWCVWTFLTYFSTSMETLSFNFKVLFFLF